MSLPEGARRLVPLTFDPEEEAWVEAPPCTRAPPPETFTIVSWNVWFGRNALEARADALLDAVEACRADAIGLQEVTPPFLERLLARPAIRDAYWVSDAEGETLAGYGTLLLGLKRAPVCALWQRALSGHMGRTLLCAEIDVGDGSPALSVGTVHLESLRHNADTRADQLEEIQPILRSRPGDAVLAGDFNFCSSWREENGRIGDDFIDLWAALHPRTPGYTEDTDINEMLLHKEGKEKQVRFDRVFLRSPGRRWRPAAIRLLGTAPIDAARPDVFPSDHFGLVATLARTS